MSAKTGRAPTLVIASAVAMNVWAAVMTSSPGPTPRARTDRSGGLDVLGPGGFEPVDLLAKDEAGGVEHALDRAVDVGADRPILRRQIHHGHPHLTPLCRG